jgi:hypothetical protein
MSGRFPSDYALEDILQVEDGRIARRVSGNFLITLQRAWRGGRYGVKHLKYAERFQAGEKL